MAFRRVLLSHLRRSRHTYSSLSPHHVPAPAHPSIPLGLLQTRFFSTPSDMDSELTRLRDVSIDGFGSNGHGLELGDLSQDLIGAGVSNYDYLTRPAISLLDSYHDLTGLPWWVVIASSTVAFRTALLPGSGRSVIDQFKLFRKERKAIGCPSFLWVPAYLSIQVILHIFLRNYK
ncbi:PREDICTED: ALBINO3-like protein 3, mitochondrial [Camelina sativa]|uniref:ALBINO3-like protein 3, mitochondrial n=1 Tax=Camelina sativa TaxID=90675 RepID=A0ABM1RS63_CAMSA|nr:PREDICTED: ALBINO3-like protein 3, mitochondrial [Camelina sativa]